MHGNIVKASLILAAGLVLAAVALVVGAWVVVGEAVARVAPIVETHAQAVRDAGQTIENGVAQHADKTNTGLTAVSGALAEEHSAALRAAMGDLSKAIGEHHAQAIRDAAGKVVPNPLPMRVEGSMPVTGEVKVEGKKNAEALSVDANLLSGNE